MSADRQKLKINNSYESSGSGSSTLSEPNEELACEDESITLPCFLQPPIISSADAHLSTQEPKGLPEKPNVRQTQDSRFDMFDDSKKKPQLRYGETPKCDMKMMTRTKISLPLKYYEALVEENSSNAVDLQLSHKFAKQTDGVQTAEIATPGSNMSKELSFNGKIRDIREKMEYTNSAPCAAVTKLRVENTASPNTSQLTESFVLKKYSNERSPDLFGDDDTNDDDDDDDEDAGNETAAKTHRYEQLLEQTNVEAQGKKPRRSEASHVEEATSDAASALGDHTAQQLRETCQREKELLRRVRLCLAGVPPPPSFTIPQLDMFSTILSHKDEILNYLKPVSPRQCIERASEARASIFKPTHALDKVATMDWAEVRSVRQHGLSFNLCQASESHELLSLSVIDRFIGSETASSYRNTATPSSAKKRNSRLKLLTQSPGNRLSHLAKRRAVFSSANLATTSLKPLGPQILIKSRKGKHKVKATPKRKTPGSKKKCRKTPSSSARKRLFFCDVPKLGPSRETSKRALFQSPAKQVDLNALRLSIKPEVANRVEKSKRALFSPDKLSFQPSTSATAAMSDNATTSKLEYLLKRKRNTVEDDDELVAQSSKLFRCSSDNLTPRALKIKSQSFCIGASSFAAKSTTAAASSGAVNPNVGLSHSQWGGGSSSSLNMSQQPANKMQRAHSDMVVQAHSLTDNQRKKLLWAVSQALQERKVTVKHEHFKQYASVLARVVRRVFQEYYQNTTTSNSETMLRLAKKYAYNVIAGKGADDVYFQAKAHIDDAKLSQRRLSGYIGVEEYQQRNSAQQLAGAVKAQQHAFNISEQYSLDSLRVSIAQQSAASASGLKPSTNAAEPNEGALPLTQPLATIESVAALEHCSSSKNNLGGLALRENVDCELRRSAQKNFTGKDQRNLSPFVGTRLGGGSGLKTQAQPSVADLKIIGAKRQISFDS